jgi:hypothetical protein
LTIKACLERIRSLTATVRIGKLNASQLCGGIFPPILPRVNMPFGQYAANWQIFCPRGTGGAGEMKRAEIFFSFLQ